MAYIDPALIADEHFEYLNTNFDLSVYDSQVDRRINSVCLKEGVAVADIPVSDPEGYVTSIPLQEYGILVYKYLVFEGYWGKNRGNQDIYYAKMQELKFQMEKAEKCITKETICGYTPDTPSSELTPDSLIKIRPMY